MKTPSRILFLLALSCAAFRAERSDTITAIAANNAAATGPTSVVRNIGQSQHMAWFILSNAPTHVCAAQVTLLYIEASFDGTNFFRLKGLAGDNISFIGPDANGVLQQSLSVVGAAPYIRLNLNTFDTVNCRMTAIYTGTIFPFTQDQPQPPWVLRPDGFTPFNNFAAIATPTNNGTDTAVITFTVPATQDGIIDSIITRYTGGGFVEASGDLVWKLKRNGVTVTNYDSITVQLGSLNAPMPISPVRVFASDVVTLTVAHAASSGLAIAGTKVFGALGGYFYPIKSR